MSDILKHYMLDHFRDQFVQADPIIASLKLAMEDLENNNPVRAYASVSQAHTLAYQALTIDQLVELFERRFRKSEHSTTHALGQCVWLISNLPEDQRPALMERLFACFQNAYKIYDAIESFHAELLAAREAHNKLKFESAMFGQKEAKADD